MENITEEVLGLAVAVHLSSMGYYTILKPEIRGKKYSPSVAAIKPRLGELKKRADRGLIPPIIAYSLDDSEWVEEDTLVREAELGIDSLENLLKECSGWVERRVEGGVTYLRLKDYLVPSRECVMVNCGYENPIRAIRTLRDLKDCCNRAYLVFPFYVDEVFMDHCVDSGVGLQVFHGELGFFKELVPAEFDEVTNLKSFRYLCELVIKENLPHRLG